MKIMGKAVLTKEQMLEYINKVNPNPKLNTSVSKIIDLFLSEGELEGVRGDIAFVQATWETNNFKFGGDVDWKQNNYSGIGATGGGEPGNSFPNPQIGVRAQIQHLKGYASTDKLNLIEVDPRYKFISPKGKAPTVQKLIGNWAADKKYDIHLINRYNEIATIPIKKKERDILSEVFLVAQPIKPTLENIKLFKSALDYFLNGESNFLVVGKNFKDFGNAKTIVIIDSENFERAGAPSVQYLVKNEKDVEVLKKGQSYWKELRK